MEQTFYWETGNFPELFEDVYITSCFSIQKKRLRESEKCPCIKKQVLSIYE